MGNKKPCLHRGKQGWKSYVTYVTCLPFSYPYYNWADVPDPWIARGQTNSLQLTVHGVSLARRASSAIWRLICSCSVSLNVQDVYHNRQVTFNLYFRG